MPETLEPPTAPASTGSALPPQTGEIQLGQSNSTPTAPAKPGSAKAAMLDRMRSKAGGDKPSTTTTTPPATPPKAPEAPKTEAPKNEQSKAPETQAKSTNPDTNNATTETGAKEVSGDNKKVSPWKLVDQFKQRALAAEQRALELEKQVLPEAERTATTERLTKAEQRAKELEDEMRYVNYTKSSEFKEKYEVPFQRSVGSAMKELQGLSFQDDKGVAKQFDVNVLMELVNLPLHQARAISNNLFGDLSNDVMNHRNEIRKNLDEQAAAIETAKKTGAEREAQQREQLKSFYSQVGTKAKEWWEGFNQEVQKHPEHGEFVKPKEGNEEWNAALEKGFEMAKKAFSVNVTDHRLTPEQRKEAVKLQSALYNKAAAYGPMRIEIKALRKALAERESELGKYKSTTPAAGGQSPQSTPNAPVNGKEALFSRLRSKAIAI